MKFQITLCLTHGKKPYKVRITTFITAVQPAYQSSAKGNITNEDNIFYVKCSTEIFDFMLHREQVIDLL